jgi:hypothetical protein
MRNRRVIALVVGACAALALTIGALPAGAANGLAASGHVVLAPHVVSGPYKVVFACEAHGTVPMASTGIEYCNLYRRTATGWQKLAAAQPRKGVPGDASASVGTYDLPVRYLASLRACWKANGMTLQGSTFVSNSGCSPAT